MATNLATAYVKIIPTTQGIQSQLQKELSGQMTSAGASTGGNFAEGFKTAAATIGKTAVAAVSAAAAGVAALTKSAVENYAEYEQLVGGVETLFEESADLVEGYADQAFKTAGLSANDYMETVTSFSASLLQSLDGDTTAAAETANRAIIDMSDNANKMGTSMESIQNAYQGFAKQNFMMLDNLKLGYGGTKTEMERLLKEAEKLPAAMGRKFDISSYADIVDAIHLVQENMGIAGTTADEASTTIQGSMKALSGAWSNLLTGMSNENADIDKLLGELVDSFMTVADNLVPRIEATLPRIIEAVSSLANTLIPEVSRILLEMAPVILETLTGMVGQLTELLPLILQVITDALPIVAEAVTTFIPAAVDALIAAAPMLLDAGLQLVSTLIDGFVNSAPELIPKIVEVLTNMVLKLTDPESLEMIIGGALILIQALAEGLIQALPELIAALPQIIENITNYISEHLWEILEIAIEIVITIAKGIIEALPQLLEAMGEMILEVGECLLKLIGDALTAGKDFIVNLWEGIKSWATQFWSNFTGWLDEIWDKITGFVDKFFDAGKNLVEGLWNGIKGSISWLANKISGWLDGVWDDILDFFGIHSPSKQMAWVGSMLDQGLARGIMQGLPSVYDAVGDLEDAAMVNYDINGRATWSRDDSGVIEYMERLEERMSNLQVVLDTGRLVGGIEAKTDEALGQRQNLSDRGVALA